MEIMTSEYKHWLGELKQRIRHSQIKAAIKVNTELLQLYWQLGGEIVERQQNAKWGDGFLKQLSEDLNAEFPEMKGFSLRNLERIRNWYLFYYECNTITAQAVPQLENANRQQVVGKIDAVTTKQPVSQLGNGIRAQVVPQLGKHFRKQSLSSPRRGNESLAQGIALGIIAQTNNVLKGQKHYRYVTITL